jgi:hypothetical protein
MFLHDLTSDEVTDNIYPGVYAASLSNTISESFTTGQTDTAVAETCKITTSYRPRGVHISLVSSTTGAANSGGVDFNSLSSVIGAYTTAVDVVLKRDGTEINRWAFGASNYHAAAVLSLVNRVKYPCSSMSFLDTNAKSNTEHEYSLAMDVTITAAGGTTTATLKGKLRAVEVPMAGAAEWGG